MKTLQKLSNDDGQIIRSALDDILKQRQFAHLSLKNDDETLSQMFLQFVKTITENSYIKKFIAFSEKLLSLFLKYLYKLLPGVKNNDIYYEILIICSIILITVFFFHMTKALKNNLIFEDKKRSDAIEHSSLPDIIEFEKKAASLALQQNFATAISYLYNALLLDFQNRKFISDLRLLTNGEIIMILSDQNHLKEDLIELFRKICISFDEKFYAEKTATKADYLEFREDYVRLRKKI